MRANRPQEALPAVDLLRVREVAAHLQLTTTSVYRLVRSGELGAIRIGRTIRVPADSLRRYQSRSPQRYR